MSATDLVSLDQWQALERDRAQAAVDLALKMLADGHIEPSKTILRALSNRLAVDTAVEIFWEQHDELDGGECFVCHQ